MKISMLVLILSLFTSAQIGEPNPRQYFGEDYLQSLIYLQKKFPALSAEIIRLKQNPKEITAIVFPELIRFNRFSNFIETSALEISYQHVGSHNMDFSIGPFQIKPSFAEKVEQLVLNNKVPSIFSSLLIENSLPLVKQREIRLQRLKEAIWQIRYACAFVDYQIARYPGLISADSTSRLAFLATAFNTTFGVDSITIRKRQRIKTYPFGIKFPNPYSYASVSIYFAQHDYSYITKNKSNQ